MTLPLIPEARLAERRLKAAVRRSSRFNVRPRTILAYLQQVRRHDERNIVSGPFAHLSQLSGFMRDYREAIDSECRWAAERKTDDTLVALSGGHRKHCREHRGV